MGEKGELQSEHKGQFRVINGGLSADNTQNSDMETIIEYVGPKRLPRVSVVKKQIELEHERAWNILNFFRRRNHR